MRRDDRRELYTDISKKIRETLPFNEEKKKLTENWILLMLYEGPKTSTDLIRDGCKVMVFGWEYPEFMEILNNLKNQKKIWLSGTNYTLTEHGLFEVKKNTIIPLLKLTEKVEYLRQFNEANKTNCDTQFLSLLFSKINEKEKEKTIINFGVQNFDKIVIIIQTAIQWYAQNPPG